MELQLASHAHIHWHTCNTFKTHTNINKLYKILKVAEDSTLKKRNPQECHMWPWGFRKNKGCSHILHSARMSASLTITIRANDMVSLSWGSTQLLTTGLPIILPKNFSPLLPKRPTWSLSSLALRLGIEEKKRRNMTVSLADPACLKCRCGSVRGWHLLLALLCCGPHLTPTP